MAFGVRFWAIFGVLRVLEIWKIGVGVPWENFGAQTCPPRLIQKINFSEPQRENCRPNGMNQNGKRYPMQQHNGRILGVNQQPRGNTVKNRKFLVVSSLARPFFAIIFYSCPAISTRFCVLG